MNNGRMLLLLFFSVLFFGFLVYSFGFVFNKMLRIKAEKEYRSVRKMKIDDEKYDYFITETGIVQIPKVRGFNPMTVDPSAQVP